MSVSIENKRIHGFLRYSSLVFFYFHLVVFIGINSLLIVTNFVSSPNKPWFIIPLSSWGIFLFAHFLLLFFTNSRSAQNWREAKAKIIAPDLQNLGLTHPEIKKMTTTMFFCWMAFYFHLGVFIGCSIIMIIINYFTTPDYYWSLVAIAAWGVWVLIHFLLTYLAFATPLNKWRINKIQGFIYTKKIKPGKKEQFREATILFGFWIVFRLHVLLYFLANFILFLSDIHFNTTTHRWFPYPIIGWGIFLLAHWLVTFLIVSPVLVNWREQKINTLMEQ